MTNGSGQLDPDVYGYWRVDVGDAPYKPETRAIGAHSHSVSLCPCTAYSVERLAPMPNRNLKDSRHTHPLARAPCPARHCRPAVLIYTPLSLSSSTPHPTPKRSPGRIRSLFPSRQSCPVLPPSLSIVHGLLEFQRDATAQVTI